MLSAVLVRRVPPRALLGAGLAMPVAGAALLGVAQFLSGGAAAPLAGIAGPHSAVPLATVIAVLSVGALLAYVFLVLRPASAPARRY